MNFRTRLSYDPGLDRLVGGDSLREFQGRPCKSTLISMRRAERLYRDMQEFGDAYETEFGLPIDRRPPYPQPLAVMELTQMPVEGSTGQEVVSIRELFTTDALTIAPPEYHRLAQMVAVIPDDATVELGRSLSALQLTAVARQIFQLVRCAHQLIDASLSRGEGSCLLPEYLTPQGQLNDLYFLMRSSEVTSVALRAAREADLRHAYAILALIADVSSDSLREAYEAALAVYAGSKQVRDDVRTLAITFAGMHRAGSSARQRREHLARLASAIVEAYA